jgi:membrane fusion protein
MNGSNERPPAHDGDAGLFRAPAVRADRSRLQGDAMLVGPPSFKWLTLTAAIASGLFVCLAVWGRYTTHSTVSGELVPYGGVIRVHAPQSGTVVEKHVRDGQEVVAGEALYVISSDRLGGDLGATGQAVERELELRLRTLEAQLSRVRVLAQTEQSSIARVIAAVLAEDQKLRTMLSSLQARAALAADAAARVAPVEAMGLLPLDERLARENELLEQRSRVIGVQRERANLASHLAELEGRRASLPLEYESQAAELERALSDTRGELAENTIRQRAAIVAPVSGTVTAVLGELGLTVDPSTVLAAIVPHAARLQAHLYVPSRAIGFVEAGDRVLLRYEAFPYQKFGQQKGLITAVSGSALTRVELTGERTGDGVDVEPLYRVTVELAAQTITAYGAPRALRAGMRVDAELMRETRRVYEWVLEPLYAIGGRMRDAHSMGIHD